MRLLRDPLWMFLLAGLVIYSLFTAVAPDRKPEIVLDAATRDALVDEFEMLTGRAAGAADVARLERDFVTNEVLFREALARGMHLTSPDVRSTLVAAMRYRVTGVLPEPTPEELVNFYAENIDRYRSEPTISFGHVYFENAIPDGIGDAIRSGRVPDGDPFPHGRQFPGYGESMLRGLFGQDFLERLKAQPLNEWSDPIRSTYGTHYVYVTGRTAAGSLPFGTVRPQVESDYRQALIDAAVARELTELEAGYAIRIED